MIVVDVNVIAYLLIEGEHTLSAEAVFRKDHTWAVPLLWRSEMQSVLTAYLRTHAMTVQMAVAIMEKASSLVKGREYSISSQRVLETVSASKCSSYDCEYIALAHDLGVKLVTADKQVLASFPAVAVTPIAFTRA